MSNQDSAKEYAAVRKTYTERSIRARIEALFLDNIGKVVTREQIVEVATDPVTGRVPENWHQRLSELRTDKGYTILSKRDRKNLGVSEYLMPTAERREVASKRVKINSETWRSVLEKADFKCQWNDGGITCELKEGDIDPIGGGTVKLTPDHKQPHSMSPDSDPTEPNAWQVLCGRHQVVKKNYWDHTTGKLNVYAIVQAAPEQEKRRIYEFLTNYFGNQ